MTVLMSILMAVHTRFTIHIKSQLSDCAFKNTTRICDHADGSHQVSLLITLYKKSIILHFFNKITNAKLVSINPR